MADDWDDDDNDEVPRFKYEKTRLGVDPAKPVLDRIAGESFGERYTIGAPIGQGGMGEVLLAYDERIGREVAVKRIRSTSPSPEVYARFVREARVQGRLEHPAVVPVHDLAVDRDGRPYFVMKRLTGIEMHDVLKRMRSGDDPDEDGSRRRLLRAFADVCLAVEFAHSRNIIHRDLKPANIMLGDFGEVYVLDWGVARSPGDPPATTTFARPRETASTPVAFPRPRDPDSAETRAGAVLGTPAYMAPEQLAGDRVGPAADVYALGCILFEIAAGEPLHPRTRTVGQAVTLADARPSQRRAGSPPELDAICLRATAIEADDRFPSARALGAAVQAYLDGNRDVAVRKELAQRHVEDARSAIAHGNDETDRIAALRAAGRALALDPTSTEAADLVTHITLQPPREVPAEVERALHARELDSARRQGRLAAISLLGSLAFIPFILWAGLRDPVMLVTMACLAIAGASQIFISTQSDRIDPRQVYFNAVVNALLIATVVRLVGPFVIAPTLVVTTLMVFAAHPLFGRIAIVSVIVGAGLAVPWLLEVFGVIEPTYAFDDGKLVLFPAVIFESAPTQIAFALLFAMFVVVVGMLLRTMATSQRDATRRLELQAWHLRQIVPTRAR